MSTEFLLHYIPRHKIFSTLTTVVTWKNPLTRIAITNISLGIFEGMARLTDRLLAGAFILALVAHAYLGSFSRYMADDYTMSTMARARGLFSAQVYWYLHWTGRFSFNFVASLLGLIGPATT